MPDDLRFVLLFAALLCFAGAALAADRRGVRNALFLVACLAFLGFMVAIATDDALLNANVQTMMLGR